MAGRHSASPERGGRPRRSARSARPSRASIWTARALAIVVVLAVLALAVFGVMAVVRRISPSTKTGSASASKASSAGASGASATKQVDGLSVSLAAVPIAVRIKNGIPAAVTVRNDGSNSLDAKVTLDVSGADNRWTPIAETRASFSGGETKVELNGKPAARGRVKVRASVTIDGKTASSAPQDVHVVGSKVVALTFDDGPSGATTPLVRKALAKHNALATFVLSGKLAERGKSSVRKTAAAGHEIASHTYSHKDLTKMTPDQVEADLIRGRDVLEKITGKAPVGVRPAYGAANEQVRELIHKAGMVPLLWDVDTLDWSSKNADSIVKVATTEARDGSIVLMHDSGGQKDSTGVAVDRVLTGLEQRGFDFVTFSELLALGRINYDKLVGSSADFGPGFSNREQ